MGCSPYAEGGADNSRIYLFPSLYYLLLINQSESSTAKYILITPLYAKESSKTKGQTYMLEAFK